MTTTYLPYNFVPFGEKAKRQPVRTHEKLGGLSGKITCHLTTLTPLFVAGHHGRSSHQEDESLEFNTSGGVPIIPGSSLKGVVRAIAEAISGSCLTLPQKMVYRGRRPHDPKTSYRIPNDFMPCRYEEHSQKFEACPACQIFGLLSGKSVHLGRVNFGDGRAQSTVEFKQMTLAATGAPAPRHKPFYATPDSGFNAPRGRKFYYHRTLDVLTDKESTRFNKTVKAIKSGATFKFTVTYENLTENELALLLFALELENNMRHKIGMGKSVGLGSAEIKITRWQKIDFEARFKSLGGGCVLLSDQDEAALRSEIDLYKQVYKTHYVRWQPSLEALAEILHWDENDAIDRRHPSHQWFRNSDFQKIPLEDVPRDAWEYGQKQARQSGQAPSYQHHGHVQQTTTSRADGDALKRMQREASRQQQQTLAQAPYQHREVERARIISVSDSAFEVSLSKIENKSYQVKKKNRFRSYQIGAKIRVRILVNANGEITRVEEV